MNLKQIDRIEIPKFYTMINPESRSPHRNSFGQVFAESSDHPRAGCITVGYVSKQTPLGQGIYLGFPRAELREATLEEVLAALNRDHQYGRHFRPSCQEAVDANFHLVMSRAIRNWTDDNAGGARSILGISRNEIRATGKTAQRKHDKIMRLWRLIYWKQTRAIRQALAASSAPVPA
jgi:hypothetical protein